LNKMDSYKIKLRELLQRVIDRTENHREIFPYLHQCCTYLLVVSYTKFTQGSQLEHSEDDVSPIYSFQEIIDF